MGGELFETERPRYDSASFPPPRDFQTAAHEALRRGVREGHRCQMLMAPTGAGKSYLGLRVCHEALMKSRRTMFMCDRITLIDQTSATADSYGLTGHGIIQSDHWRHSPDMPLQIASAQTIASRGWPLAEPHVVIVDEAHTQLSAWVDYIKKWKDKPLSEGGPFFIGLSATPFSKGLGQLFSNLVNAATMHELTLSGVLTPFRVFSCTPTDMKGAATSGGEWTDKAAEERGLKIVGDVVKEWVKLAEGRKTIVFGSTIKHCEELCKGFNEAGIMAATFTKDTNKTERQRLLEEYRKPDSMLRVLISVEALAKGFDVPDVGCVVDCRPLRKSLSTFIQMLGRGLRSFPGKVDCILLDHSGNIRRFVEDFTDVFYNGLASLDMGEKLDASVRKDDEEKAESRCPKCGFTPFAKRCISCGHEKQSVSLVEHVPGEMCEVFIGKQKEAAAKNARDLWHQCCTYAREHGKPETAYHRASHIFKDCYGDFQPKQWRFDDAPHVTVSRPVMAKIRSKMIAFAKASARR